MNKVDTIVKNGKIVTSSNVFEAGIAIEDGKIVQISNERLLPPAEEVINANGKLILPGMIDPHVHFLWPNISRDRIDRPWDPRFHDFESGTESAAFGGVTTIIDFVYQYANEISMEEAINNRFKETRRSNIDYALHTMLVGASIANHERLYSSIDAGLEAGATSVKVFMSDHRGRTGLFSSNDKIYDAMVHVKQKGGW